MTEGNLSPERAAEQAEIKAKVHEVDNEPLPDLKRTLKDVGIIAWPSILELVLTSLTGIVDQIMVGQVSPLAIAAVGLSGQPKMLLQSAFFAFNVGTTALVARFRGAGNQLDANRALRQNIMLTAMVSTLMAAIGAVFSTQLVHFMGSDEMSAQTLIWSVQYFRIQMIGFPFLAISMAITAGLRGVGNTRASLVLNSVSNFVNVGLNYCLIYGRLGFPRLDIAGASIATVVGQMVACSMALTILLRGRQYLFVHKGDSFKPDIPLIKRIARIGLPSMGEQLCMRFGMITFVKVIAGLGDIAFSAHQIGMSMMNLSFMNGQAFGIAATTLVGQSLGRLKPKLAQHYARITSYVGQGVSLIIALVLIVFRRQLVVMFIGSDIDPAIDVNQIIEQGAQVLLVLAAIQPFQSSQLVVGGALRGAGDTRFTMLVILVGMVFMRPLLGYTAVEILDFGLVGAWCAMFLDQFVRFAMMRWRFNTGKWTKIKV